MTATSLPTRSRLIAGWIAVTLNLATAGLWAYWGAIEAFHEGWWHDRLLTNLLLTLAYLAPCAIFVFLGLVGIRWPRMGAGIILAFTVWFWWWWDVPAKLLRSSAQDMLTALVMSGASGMMIALWWLGRPHPRAWAARVTIGVPLLVSVLAGAWPAYLVATRIDDGDRGVRTIEGNGVTLVWAPAGPGWPQRGGQRWSDAARAAQYLSPDGATLMDEPQHGWRLPTRDEVVRSMVRRGVNAGGDFDPATASATYARAPNKETPLWNPRSEIIYWWTADEADEHKAWSIAWNGSLLARTKEHFPGTLGFRLVRDPGNPAEAGSGD